MILFREAELRGRVEREGDVGVDGWEAVAEEGEGWKGREGFDLGREKRRGCGSRGMALPFPRWFILMAMQQDV